MTFYNWLFSNEKLKKNSFPWQFWCECRPIKNRIQITRFIFSSPSFSIDFSLTIFILPKKIIIMINWSLMIESLYRSFFLSLFIISCYILFLNSIVYQIFSRLSTKKKCLLFHFIILSLSNKDRLKCVSKYNNYDWSLIEKIMTVKLFLSKCVNNGYNGGDWLEFNKLDNDGTDGYKLYNFKV